VLDQLIQEALNREAFLRFMMKYASPVPSILSSNMYYGGPGNDQITGSSSNDTINGQGGDDILNGGAGNDTLYGGAGNDILAGGSGNDILWGGIGADKFFYSSPSEGIDIIKDYSFLEGDRIVVSKAEFGATSTNQFSYNNITGALFFQGTQFVTLENKPADFSTSLGIELV
jgi:Ca2+-binding RTX toxin-like protein